MFKKRHAHKKDRNGDCINTFTMRLPNDADVYTLYTPTESFIS